MRAFTKKIIMILASCMALIGLVGGCSFTKEDLKPSKPTVKELQNSAMAPANKVDAILNAMTDEEKVGQLLIFGIHGTEMNADSTFMVQAFKPGGVILFDRNMVDKNQVQQLIKGLKQVNGNSGDFPLFVAIDQEGGCVSRMQDGLIKVPEAAQLGEQPVNVAVDYAQKAGSELSALGFNLNFAPDADLGLACGRSFGTDPMKVVTYAGAVGTAYYRSGLLFSYKHFPGIGKTDSDLHEDSSVISIDKAKLEAEDIRVFQSLIGTTVPNRYMIMVSHANYSALDPNKPASLSKPIITDLLRKQLGFNGVVVTDDLEMGALSNHYTFGDMAVESILAGSDILLVCHEYDHMKAAYEGLLEAVKSGKISKDRLNDSIRRILLMKQGMK